MNQLDKLKKWLNEIGAHYETLRNLSKLLPTDRACMDAYDSVKKNIEEIEAQHFVSNDKEQDIVELAKSKKEITNLLMRKISNANDLVLDYEKEISALKGQIEALSQSNEGGEAKVDVEGIIRNTLAENISYGVKYCGDKLMQAFQGLEATTLPQPAKDEEILVKLWRKDTGDGYGLSFKEWKERQLLQPPVTKEEGLPTHEEIKKEIVKGLNEFGIADWILSKASKLLKEKNLKITVLELWKQNAESLIEFYTLKSQAPSAKEEVEFAEWVMNGHTESEGWHMDGNLLWCNYSELETKWITSTELYQIFLREAGKGE